MSASTKLAYGTKTVSFSTDRINLIDVLRLQDIQPLADPAQAMLEALANPIDSPRLKEVVSPDEKVAVIVNDDTRVSNTSFFLPLLLAEIESGGVAKENISIVFANGTHRLLPEETQRELIGDFAYDNFRVINHDCKDQESLVYVGQTSRGNKVEVNRYVYEADTIVLSGSIVYHFFAGYGGGRKAAVPGTAGFNTIMFNHRLMLQDGAELGRLEGNPVHEDIIEAVGLLNKKFLFNVVLNENKQFLGFFAGDYIKAHAAGCNLVDQAYGVTITEEADLVIASCGGYPKDINIYQAQKTLDNAIKAVRAGGVVILLAQCPEELGSPTLKKWLEKYDSPQAIREAIHENFVIGGHKAFALTRLTEKTTIILVSDLGPELVRRMHFTPANSVDAAIDQACAILGEKPRTYIIPQGSLTLPLKS